MRNISIRKAAVSCAAVIGLVVGIAIGVPATAAEQTNPLSPIPQMSIPSLCSQEELELGAVDGVMDPAVASICYFRYLANAYALRFRDPGFCPKAPAIIRAVYFQDQRRGGSALAWADEALYNLERTCPGWAHGDAKHRVTRVDGYADPYQLIKEQKQRGFDAGWLLPENFITAPALDPLPELCTNVPEAEYNIWRCNAFRTTSAAARQQAAIVAAGLGNTTGIHYFELQIAARTTFAATLLLPVGQEPRNAAWFAREAAEKAVAVDPSDQAALDAAVAVEPTVTNVLTVPLAQKADAAEAAAVEAARHAGWIR